MEPAHRDRNGYLLGGKPETMKPLNVSWPLHDNNGWHARGINDQANPIEVFVRVVWSDGAEELLLASAIRWNDSHVFCEVEDPRIDRPGIWVKARDVRRR